MTTELYTIVTHRTLLLSKQSPTLRIQMLADLHRKPVTQFIITIAQSVVRPRVKTFEIYVYNKTPRHKRYNDVIYDNTLKAKWPEKKIVPVEQTTSGC